MISKIECIIITCDNCENPYEDGNGFSIFVDEDSAHPEDDEWYIGEGEHYCPSCYEIDENDNLILRKVEKQSQVDDRELPHLNQSTENLSKIEDKDKRLHEVRGEDEN